MGMTISPDRRENFGVLLISPKANATAHELPTCLPIAHLRSKMRSSTAEDVRSRSEHKPRGDHTDRAEIKE